MEKIATANTVRNVMDVRVQQACQGSLRANDDVLAVEEPLEIRLSYTVAGEPRKQNLSVTMRTPGDDFELAAGFLLTEAIIHGADDIERIEFCTPCGRPLDLENDSRPGAKNIVTVHLRQTVSFDPSRLQRHFYTTSSCGVCGKTSLDALKVQGYSMLPPGTPVLDGKLIAGLPDKLRQAQPLFNRTGGLHAAGLFDTRGNLLDVKEDVGRHNAVDKLIGTRVLSRTQSFSGCILQVSGRLSFELIQKALAARIPIVLAVGAPSSLAVTLAAEFGMTLVGFIRDDRFNIYTDSGRIKIL